MPNENIIGRFEIILDNRGDTGLDNAKESPSSSIGIRDDKSLKPETSSQDDARSPEISSDAISDDEILRGIRYVETAEGRRSDGKRGGYSEKLDETGVYGAYQIMKKVWQPKIKEKFGWDFEDWFSDNPNGEDSDLFKVRQDRIARELILPEHKRQVKASNLYQTPLGRHLPQGTLEVLSQLGVGNLKRFLTTGYDNTAYESKQSGQMMGYLESVMKLFGKKIPRSFYSELDKLGGVSTKYAQL